MNLSLYLLKLSKHTIYEEVEDRDEYFTQNKGQIKIMGKIKGYFKTDSPNVYNKFEQISSFSGGKQKI